MPKPRKKRSSPITKIADELKHLGEIEVTGWDFAELLNKDLSDLELTRSLRRLGAIRVTDWEFKDVLPVVDRLAHKEVDLARVFQRTANYRVTEWDFRDLLQRDPVPQPKPRHVSGAVDPAVMASLQRSLQSFLAYLMEQLIDRPDKAAIEIEETEPGVLTAKITLVPRDSVQFIGRGGHTAEAIRRVLQMAALRHRVHVLLRIVSRDD